MEDDYYHFFYREKYLRVAPLNSDLKFIHVEPYIPKNLSHDKAIKNCHIIASLHRKAPFRS